MKPRYSSAVFGLVPLFLVMELEGVLSALDLLMAFVMLLRSLSEMISLNPSSLIEPMILRLSSSAKLFCLSTGGQDVLVGDKDVLCGSGERGFFLQ